MSLIVLQALAKLLAIIVASAIAWALRDVFSRSRDVPGRPEPRRATVEALKRFTDHLERCPRCSLDRGRESLCAGGRALYEEKERTELPDFTPA